MANVNDLPILDPLPKDAYAHLWYNNKDYKKKVEDLFSGGSVYIGLAVLSGDPAYVVSSPVPQTAYQQGVIYHLKFSADPTDVAGVTVNIDGLGAKSVKRYNLGSKETLTRGDIMKDVYLSFIYDGTDFVLNDCCVGRIFTKKVIMSPEDIEGAGPGTPFTMIAAPGAGFATKLIDPVFRLAWETGNTQWNLGGAAGAFLLRHATSATQLFSVPTSDYTANAVRCRPMAETTSEDIIENSAIVANFSGAAPISGDSPFEIHLSYRYLRL